MASDMLLFYLSVAVSVFVRAAVVSYTVQDVYSSTYFSPSTQYAVDQIVGRATGYSHFGFIQKVIFVIFFSLRSNTLLYAKA